MMGSKEASGRPSGRLQELWICGGLDHTVELVSCVVPGLWACRKDLDAKGW